MRGFLPSTYLRYFKWEKTILGSFLIFILLGVIFISGIIFILPSYFALTFSLNDILRRTNTEEVFIKRKDVDGLESKISHINSLLDAYFDGESKKKLFSGVLLAITNATFDEIKLTGIDFQQDASKNFVFHIRGEAVNRNVLISYSQKLRQLKEIKELRSPVSNLLQEANIKFLLEVVINPQYYEYKN
ncbi:MAG: hypothetical protein AAB522_01560 [Patescibacteria group bacterium]